MATGVVPAPPANTAPPTITATAQAGQTLTASAGTWTGAATYTYQFVRGATVVATTGPTASVTAPYTVTTADLGQTIAVKVTASGPGGTASATSAAVPTAPAAGASVPTISGTPQQGQTLTRDACPLDQRRNRAHRDHRPVGAV